MEHMYYNLVMQEVVLARYFSSCFNKTFTLMHVDLSSLYEDNSTKSSFLVFCLQFKDLLMYANECYYYDFFCKPNNWA